MPYWPRKGRAFGYQSQSCGSPCGTADCECLVVPLFVISVDLNRIDLCQQRGGRRGRECSAIEAGELGGCSKQQGGCGSTADGAQVCEVVRLAVLSLSTTSMTVLFPRPAPRSQAARNRRMISVTAVNPLSRSGDYGLDWMWSISPTTSTLRNQNNRAPLLLLAG